MGGTNTWNGLITATTATENVVIGSGGGANFTIATAATITTGTSGVLQFHTDTDSGGTAVGTITVNSDISGGAGVRKLGSNIGILTLSGTAKSYSGATSLTNGIMGVNTTLTNTSGFTSSAGTILRGNNGVINTAVTTTIGGTLAPGATSSTIGVLTMGDLVQTAGSMLSIDLNSTTSAIDRVNVNNLSMSGTVSLTLNDLGPGTLNVGDALLFIKTSGVWNGGLFTYGGNVIADESTTFSVGSNTFMIDYNRIVGADTGVALVAVIPETSSAMLLMLSALGFATRRSRRNR